MARDEDMDDAPGEDEVDEETESEEGDDESLDDDFELETDEGLIEDGEFEEGEEHGDEETAVVRPQAKRRSPLRHVPMIEGVPKAKLEKPEFAREVWNRLDGKYNAAKPKKYLISGAYDLHDQLEHTKFGVGYVTEVLSPNKIEVIFQDSIRKLVQKR